MKQQQRDESFHSIFHLENNNRNTASGDTIEQKNKRTNERKEMLLRQIPVTFLPYFILYDCHSSFFLALKTTFEII